MTPEERILFLLHFEIINEKYAAKQNILVTTLVKYLFLNDPCSKIIYLTTGVFGDEPLIKSITSLKNYSGEIEDPMKN